MIEYTSNALLQSSSSSIYQDDLHRELFVTVLLWKRLQVFA